MSSQLPLSLSQPIRYSSATFLEHAGVQAAVTAVLTLAQQRGFALLYIMGEPRAGKTHLGVYLVGKLQHEQQRDARLVDGAQLRRWYSEELPQAPFQAGAVVMIDDIDLFLEGDEGRKHAGIFVDIAERLALAEGTLVLLASRKPEKLACSSQAKSRIEAGIHLLLGDPQDADLDLLLDLITKQRGLQLKESKRSYLLRRVTRTLPALVECVDRLEDGGDFASPSTSYELLSGALGTPSA